MAGAVPGTLPAQAASWRLEPTPLLVLGNGDSETGDTFETAVSSTRLPDGRILVGDRGAYALRMFSPDGAPLKRFARKGKGPGEIDYLVRMLRCGDSIVTVDAEARKVSVFTLEGVYQRVFRFGGPSSGDPGPYTSTCNPRGEFVHYGWVPRSSIKSGVFRAMVSLWTSRADSAVGLRLGELAGSERFGTFVDGNNGGTRPLPFGKEPSIAIGADRIYAGTADTYEIRVFSRAGAPAAAIRKAAPAVSLTRADIDARIDEEASTSKSPDARARVAQSYARMTLPKSLPAYRAFVVDADDNLWVQDYPRAKVPTVRWTVFGKDGRQRMELALPAALEIHEIGRDHVLGRYVDPHEGIPQIRLYRLTRR
jgi:hypothetical protein